MSRKAAPPTPESIRQRAANRAGRNRAEPGLTPDRGTEEVSKTFEVIGRRRIAGHKPGAQVKLTLTQGVIDSLIEAGHIKEVVQSEPKAEPVKAKPVKAPEKEGSSNG